MKLRIRGNSIRLRLGQSEVQRLNREGSVEESTAFGPLRQQSLTYALSLSPAARTIDASFVNGRIEIRVPTSVADQWAASEQVGIEAVQRAGFEAELRILIEKDFACIDAPTSESQDDAFPHPLLDAACRPAAPTRSST